jgi:endoglucanase
MKSITTLASLLCLPAMVSVGCSDPTASDEAWEVAAEADQATENKRRRGGPYASYALWVEPDGNAAQQAEEWAGSDPDGAAAMSAMAQVPISLWLGDWLDDVTDTVDDALDAAAGQLVTFVVYNIPNRDCGSFSAGGVEDAAGYAAFVAGVAAGLEGRTAIVVLEPDALSLMDCLDSEGEDLRKEMMSDAVDVLTAAGGKVYLDAGDSNWVPSDDIAQHLLDAGVANAEGFALNVSHTEWTLDEVGYAEEIRAIVGLDAHYVIDTSRNGAGPAWDNEWCNPADRASGKKPTLETGNGGLDALLWIKRPGESDGECNGGPEAGHWWPEYARDLMYAAGFGS